MAILTTDNTADNLFLRVFDVNIGKKKYKTKITVEYTLPMLVSEPKRLDQYTIAKDTTEYSEIAGYNIEFIDEEYKTNYKKERFKILGFVRSYNGGELIFVYDRKYSDIFITPSFIDFAVSGLNVPIIYFNGFRIGLDIDIEWTTLYFKGVKTEKYRVLPEIKTEKKDLFCRITKFPDTSPINQGGINTLERKYGDYTLHMGLFGHTPFIDLGTVGEIFPEGNKLPVYLLCQNGPTSFGPLYSGLQQVENIKDLNLCIFFRF